jgi:hypothetical protein
MAVAFVPQLWMFLVPGSIAACALYTELIRYSS